MSAFLNEETIPATVNFLFGLVLPIPILLFKASTYNVVVSTVRFPVMLALPEIDNVSDGVVVPIPTLSPVFANITFVPVLFHEVEFDRLPEPPASTPQLKTPFASV